MRQNYSTIDLTIELPQITVERPASYLLWVMPYPLPPGVCLVFPAATASTAANIYATTTALTTIGNGPVNIGKASSATTVDGTATVTQTLNVGAHIVATNTGAAKSVSKLSAASVTCTR